jgi:hypothetical protein
LFFLRARIPDRRRLVFTGNQNAGFFVFKKKNARAKLPSEFQQYPGFWQPSPEIPIRSAARMKSPADTGPFSRGNPAIRESADLDLP